MSVSNSRASFCCVGLFPFRISAEHRQSSTPTTLFWPLWNGICILTFDLLHPPDSLNRWQGICFCRVSLHQIQTTHQPPIRSDHVSSTPSIRSRMTLTTTKCTQHGTRSISHQIIDLKSFQQPVVESAIIFDATEDRYRKQPASATTVRKCRLHSSPPLYSCTFIN